MADWEVAETLRERAPEAGAQRVLVVIAGEVTTLPLPAEGRWTIGRAPENAVRVEDGLASRVHAAIHVGERVEVEDLGSANGTRVGGRTIGAGERVPLEPGTVIDIGDTMIVLQAKSPSPGARRLCAHSVLEARLEEECAARAGRRQASLALLRVRLDEPVPRSKLERALTEPLGGRDLVATYAPGELELLLVDASPERARSVADAVRAALPGARAAIALFPTDARTAQGLIACLAEDAGGGPPVIAAPAMVELYRVIDRVAAGTISVLLLGETGVGKELTAEAIHARSPRRSGPFVRINCAALSEQLVEAELFGFEKGAFTGADHAKAGLMEAADGGTLFLDEAGELPLATQAKLLRALEQREVMRVGSLKPRAVDVRIVSATNRDLEEAVKAGGFRRDLYFRLNGVSLEVPPLRKRLEEIEPLARLFVARAARQIGRETPEIAPETLDLLRGYGWPGNIRELKNVMDRAVLLARGEAIEPIDLPFEKLAARWTEARDEGPAGTAEEQEMRARITAALDGCAGNQTRAAQVLGMSRQSLSRWLDRLQIRRPRKPAGG